MTGDPSKKLATLLKRLRHAHPPGHGEPQHPTPPDEMLELDAPTRHLVFSLMLWETNTSHARAACRKLSESFVDANELRVAFEDEIAHVIGDKYPLGLDRARRLRATLADLFRRFHAISIAPLLELNKRDARHQVESLEGLPPFVSARIASFVFGAHALPVDERLRALLADEGIADEVTSVESVQNWLERTIPAEESHSVAILFQVWSDEVGHVIRKDPRSAATTLKPPKPDKASPKPRPEKSSAPKADRGKPDTATSDSAKSDSAKPGGRKSSARGKA